MEQLVKLSPTALPLIQLPTNAPGKAAEDGSVPHRGDPAGTLALPGPALVGVAIWGLNQQMEDLCLFYHPVFQIYMCAYTHDF